MSNKYSYSKISLYESCPFKYKLQYVDGNYVYIGNIATEFGTAVHEAEEAIAKAIQANEQINYVKIKNEFILKCLQLQAKYPKDFYAEDGKSDRNYKDKMYEYLETGVYRLEQYMSDNPTYKIIGIEQKFSFEFDSEHIFTGAIDRVFYDEAKDEYIIHDIKSWAVKAKPSELKVPLQFVVYTLAAKNIWNCDISKVHCIYDLPLVNLQQPGGKENYIEEGIEEINKLFSNIANQEYKPNANPLCNWCNFCMTNPDAVEPYKYMCPYFCVWDRETRNKLDLHKVENRWEGIENHQIIYDLFLKKYNIQINQKGEK